MPKSFRCNTFLSAILEHDTWSYVFHSLMKHVYNPEIRQILLDLIPHMRQIEKESSGVAFVVRSFKYLIRSAKGCKEKDLADAILLLTSSRGEMMTIMEQWLEYKDQAESAKERIAEAERGKLEAERREAEAELRVRAEIERREAEAERRVRAEIERGKAEAERKIAESKERDIKKLLAAGLDVQTIADCLNVPVSLLQRLQELG